MDFGTQNHLKVLRDLLEYRLRDLRRDIRGAQSVRSDATLSGVIDRKDQAESEQTSALADAEEQRDRGELARIERALSRLDHGGYGDCLECGTPIPIKRLLAQPAAELCLACQQAQERKDAVARAR
ncbi:MAG TPA: TraR/DksA family transcriptional regulator [Burkholderiaceae bacterium]|nr:TraR/DksA family transcriptional regulator [Burkholderiaceae bacterium]